MEMKMKMKMPLNAVLLVVLILIFPFQIGLKGLLFSDADPGEDADRASVPEDKSTYLRKPCSELRETPSLKFEAFGRTHSVILKPQDSVLNPFQPVRVFNGFHFHSAIEGHDFFPCLVRGSTAADDEPLNVYGNILNGSFTGFAILGDQVHHIRGAGLQRAKRDLHSSGLLSRKSLASATIEKMPEPEILMARPPKKRLETDRGQLYAKDCSLKVIADHTFYRSIGGGDIGMALSFMTYFVQEADALFRKVDFDGSGAPDLLGFKVKDMTVFEDDAAPDGYPLQDESMSSTVLMSKIAALKEPDACYVLLFTYRRFLENNLGRSYTWNPSPTEKGIDGGICAAHPTNGGLPNVGFVSVRLGKRKLPNRLSVMATTRVLAIAFGSRVDTTNVSCPVPPGTNNVMDSYFPPPTNIWNKLNPSFSGCSIKAMKQVLDKRSNCFLSVLPFYEQMISKDYEYYSVSSARMPFDGLMLCSHPRAYLHFVFSLVFFKNFNKWMAGL